MGIRSCDQRYNQLFLSANKIFLSLDYKENCFKILATIGLDVIMEYLLFP